MSRNRRVTTVVVAQSNYVPWKGYFDLIHDADLFVFYDDVQYTKNDWRNRNRIKTPRGTEWITIPTGPRLDRLVCDVEIENPRWQRVHWKTLCQNYGRAPHFERYRPFFEDVYLGQVWTGLSELNQHLIRSIARDLLGIRTELRDAREYRAEGRKLDRLLDLVRQTGATTYLSGPSGRQYIDESRFSAIGVDLRYKTYDGYPEYPQSWPPFDHAVSVLDLLFHTGPEAPWFIWGWREGPAQPK